MRKGRNGIYNLYIKRLIDIIGALIVLICLGWLYIIIAILVGIKLGHPIVFMQERPGKISKKNGKEVIFKLYKFRSMSNQRDSEGNLLSDSERLTKFGKIIRATSLDELPEVWNILKGDMSFVGPRPWLVKYLDYYDEFDRKRHYVRPGLTGLSQVSGRNGISWKERFEFDVNYVENVNFLLDLKIFMLTIRKVFIREGIEFMGKDTIMDYFSAHSKNKKM